MKNKKLLVVWCEVPEETSFIEIQPKTDKEQEMLESWHNNYINSENEPKGMCDYFYTENGVFNFSKIKEPVSTEDYSMVLIMGFLM